MFLLPERRQKKIRGKQEATPRRDAVTDAWCITTTLDSHKENNGQDFTTRDVMEEELTSEEISISKASGVHEFNH